MGQWLTLKVKCTEYLGPVERSGFESGDHSGMTPGSPADTSKVQLRFGTTPSHDFDNLNLAPPLVSFVIINWNYADFVSDAIQSVKQQDYPNFECLVIDNGSTDDSLTHIRSAVDDDPRFSIEVFDQNFGQLGAALWAIKHTNGNFISFVDADDILFPFYASTHVQAHLALPGSVAFTSSAIVEIDRDKRVLSSSSLARFDADEVTAGLSPAEKAMRISTVGDEAFERISANAITIPWSMQGWFWGPGTSNMFRRPILRQFDLPNEGKPVLRASDGHFMRLAHALTGSAVVNIPLSAYRLHDTNYYARRERLQDTLHYDLATADLIEQGNLETCEMLMRDAPRFVEIVGWRYWSMLDIVANAAHGSMRQRFYASPETRRLFIRHSKVMRSIDSDERYVAEIFKRFDPTYAQIIVGASFSGQVPNELFAPYRPTTQDADALAPDNEAGVPDNQELGDATTLSSG